jgi:hypothetical protein
MLLDEGCIQTVLLLAKIIVIPSYFNKIKCIKGDKAEPP